MFRRDAIVLVVWLAWTGVGTVHADQPRAYVMSRAPQLSAGALQQQWVPFLARVKQDSGISLSLKLYDSRATFDADLFGGVPDFAFMNPYYLVLSRPTHGYLPLVRGSEQRLTGIVVVRVDSAIAKMADLGGAEILFPDPTAFGAAVYLRMLLEQREHLSFTPRYAMGPHENIYRAVALGQAVAGGGVMSTLLREPEELRSQLRVVYETPGLAPHPLVAHPRVPEATREKVARAVLHMADDQAGRTLLRGVGLAEPVLADYTRDYRELELLGIERYLDHSQKQ